MHFSLPFSNTKHELFLDSSLHVWNQLTFSKRTLLNAMGEKLKIIREKNKQHKYNQAFKLKVPTIGIPQALLRVSFVGGPLSTPTR